MGIRFHCHHCQHELHVKDFQAGKRGRCPECQGKFRIPLLDAEYSLDVEQLPEDEMMAAGMAQRQGPLAQAQHTQAQHAQKQHAQAQHAQAQHAQKQHAQKQHAQKQHAKKQARDKRSTVSPGAKSAVEPTRPKAGKLQPAERRTSKPRPTSTQSATATTAGAPSTTPLPPEPVADEPGLPRAIVEAPAAVWHVRPTSGGQFGPAPAETLGQWLIEGRVARDALVWRDDWAEWQLAGECFAEYYGPVVDPTDIAAAASAGTAAPNMAPSSTASSSTTLPSQPNSAGSRNRLERKQRKRRRYILLLSILTVVLIGLVVALGLVLWMPS